MFDSVTIIGSGRVGSAVDARLRERKWAGWRDAVSRTLSQK